MRGDRIIKWYAAVKIFVYRYIIQKEEKHFPFAYLFSIFCFCFFF